MLPKSFYVNRKKIHQILNESTGKKVRADFSRVASEDGCILTVLPSINKGGGDSRPSSYLILSREAVLSIPRACRLHLTQYLILLSCLD